MSEPERSEARHPVSTSVGSCGLLERQAEGMLTRGAVPGRVVGQAVRPALPDDATPGPPEDADGVSVVAAAIAGSPVGGGGPGGGVARGVGQDDDGLAEALVTGPAEADGSV